MIKALLEQISSNNSNATFRISNPWEMESTIEVYKPVK